MNNIVVKCPPLELLLPGIQNLFVPMPEPELDDKECRLIAAIKHEKKKKYPSYLTLRRLMNSIQFHRDNHYLEYHRIVTPEDTRNA